MKARRYKHLRKSELNKHKLISITLMFLIILLLTKDIWAGKGYIVFSDLDFGINDKDYIGRIFGIFNEKFSSMNFFNLSRLVFITPFYLLSLLFSKFITGFLLRSIIVGVLLLSAIGMYKLCEKLLFKHFGQFKYNYHYYGLIIPAIYYAVNPWVMFRIQHIFLLPGYACYPFILNYFIDLFKIHSSECEEDFKQKVDLPVFWRKLSISKALYTDLSVSIKFALFMAIGSAAIHYFFFNVLTVLLLSIAILIHNILDSKKTWFSIKQFLRRHIILWSMTFLFCAYWIIPYLISMFATNIEPNNVNVVDTLNMFSRFSNLKNILYLISYWWPMFETSKYLDTAFWVGGGVFLFFICYIILYRIKNHYYITLFTVSTLFMIAMATGVNTNILDGVNIFIVTKIPVFGQIFRDPNKLVGPMAAFFAVLIAFAIDRYLFLIHREGFGKIGQVTFILVMLTSHYFYYRPFKVIFSQVYYSGARVPQEYQKVNENYSTESGKILWVPNMENMLLSNKIAAYKWNMPPGEEENLNLLRAVGSFHQYSSSKSFIFQHENNDGVIPYLYSFFQYLMDRTGGQHLDDMMRWTGFNEIGFHNDVYGQDERQDFNYNVLNAQKNLEKHYKDSIFTLYNVKTPQKDSFGVNNIIYQTKGLFSNLYMMGYTDSLGKNSSNTGILWAQQKKQDIQTEDTDIIAGDNKLDMVMPLMDNKYFYYPFDYVNTGNPNSGWAKSMLKDSEWNWLLKINGFNDYYEYDFGHGIAYTNVSNRLNSSNNKILNNSDGRLLGIKDILDNFFTVGDPNMFKLTIFPTDTGEEAILQGQISKGYSGNNVWQAATSKPMDVTNIRGDFLRVQSVLSGINASSIHFKILFYDESGKELGVNYLSKSDESSDFKKVTLSSDFYIPSAAKTMVINLLSFQDVNRDTYFWIHEFSIYNITDQIIPNKLHIPVKNVNSNSSFRILARVFTSSSSKSLKFSNGSEEKTISLNSNKQTFKWVDVGEMNLKSGYLELLPSDGLTVINAIAILPAEEYDNIINKELGKLKGYQTDFSLFHEDYTVEANFSIDNMDTLRILPNTIDGYITCVDKGEIYKDIDIIREGDYNLSITGNIPEGSIVKAIIQADSGKEVSLDCISVKKAVERNFSGYNYKVINEKDKYFLSQQSNINNNWDIKEYSFSKIHLTPGKYRIIYKVDSNIKNLVYKDDLHLINDEDVYVPSDQQTIDEELLYINSGRIEITKDNEEGSSAFKNSKTNSKLWIIYALKKVPVKKGQLIGYRVSCKTSGLKDLHGKLLWTDNNNVLKTTTYVSYNKEGSDFFIFCEAPLDGYVIPSFLARGTTEKEGIFSLTDAELYIIDDFSKFEGSSLVPDMNVSTNTASVERNSMGVIDVKNTRYLIQNEAYNTIWRFLSKKNNKPVEINFFHNGFITNMESQRGIFIIEPLIIFPYYFSLVISIISIAYSLFLLRKPRCRKKKDLK